MEKIFLDANVFIDLIEKRKDVDLARLDQQQLFISPLSIHILHYIAKRKVPYGRLLQIIETFSIVNIDKSICYNATLGPTDDFEDNVQLHSAAEADCNVFLTNDKRIKDLKFFGKVKID